MEKDRARQLQFLRFLAFLNVFISHAEVWNFFGYPARWSAASAVSFFFILSGLVTGYSQYGKDVSPTLGNICRNMGRRIRKLYPLYLVTVLFPVLYSAIPGMVTDMDLPGLKDAGVDFLGNLLLLQSWFPEGIWTFNSVTWFLSTLLFLNLFNLPVLYLLGKVKGEGSKRTLVFLGTIGVILLADIVYFGLTRSLDHGYWHYRFPPARLGEYLVGMILGCWLRPVVNKAPRSGKGAWLFTLWELAALVLWVVWLNVKGFWWLSQSFHWVVPNLFLLTAFLFGRGWFSRLFRAKPLVALGDISFECYMVHQLIVVRYVVLNVGQTVTVPEQIFGFGFCLLLSVLIAKLVHKQS